MSQPHKYKAVGKIIPFNPLCPKGGPNRGHIFYFMRKNEGVSKEKAAFF
jgi:hypothetical protein